MKKKKAPGIDGIPMEAWMYEGAVVKEGIVELLQKIWKEGNIPEDWKKA